jgi:5-hydroxyisourate hydrolase
MTVSTHVLDTARGVPAAGVAVVLYALDGDKRTPIGQAVTNDDGRTDAPLGSALHAGPYELVFSVGEYFKREGTVAFYDDVPVRFILGGIPGRYHVPLLISPWGYSTYRGS